MPNFGRLGFLLAIQSPTLSNLVKADYYVLQTLFFALEDLLKGSHPFLRLQALVLKDPFPLVADPSMYVYPALSNAVIEQNLHYESLTLLPAYFAPEYDVREKNLAFGLAYAFDAVGKVQ
jgi:hypothetical protein